MKNKKNKITKYRTYRRTVLPLLLYTYYLLLSLSLSLVGKNDNRKEEEYIYRFVTNNNDIGILVQPPFVLNNILYFNGDLLKE